MDAPLRILIVCTGNTCRSPMAAAALVQALAPEGDRIAVTSAGTGAAEGEPATPLACRVVARDGIDLAAHRSRRVTGEMVRDADLIFVMERGHADRLRELGARAENIHVLSEWPPPGEPDLTLSDPYGGSIEAYEECWSRIRRHVKRAAPQIQEALRSRYP